MADNKEIQIYISKIKKLLPVYSKAEKDFISRLGSNIDDFATEHPDASIEEVVAEFGEPLEVVSSYVESMDTDYLIHRISIRKVLRRIVVIVLIAALIGLSIFGGFYYKAYQYYKNTVITEGQTVIDND